MSTKKAISYINKDFNEYKNNLINYTKTYFPNTYNDFSPSSPGMLFIELASYVGDVLSFYQDNQIQENYLQFARQNKNLYELAYMFGYKPNVTGIATTTIDFYQKLPSLLSGSTYIPDFTYSLYIEPNSVISSTLNNDTKFLIEDPLDFSVSSSIDPTEITIFELSAGNPTYYLLKKSRKAISSTINTTTFSFSNPEKYPTILINDSKIVKIVDIIDTEGNNWYEVDYLAQETIYDNIKNINPNDPNNYLDSSNTPYLLKLKKVQRRFTTRFLDSGSLQIQFGSGNVNDEDENIIPNINNVGIGLPFEINKLNSAYSPSNFIFTKTYGIAPSNTILTVRYLTGGGVASNVPANFLDTITGTTKFINNNLTGATAQTIYNSLVVSNPQAADGGDDGDTIEEIRQNASSNFNSQLRNVTPDDYLVRTLSLPSKYGTIAKALIQPTKAQDNQSNSILDLYILSYDNNKRLVSSSNSLKQNLSTYLSQYKMSNDFINIKNAFIINIGINFDLIILPEFNNNEVLIRCIDALKDYFNIDKWQINQPIQLREIYILLDKIKGVETVKTVEILNKTGSGYSQYSYDIIGATRNNIIYPSLDPMIFEVLDLNSDITGRISNF